eukprot:5342961-Pyramimonas_sp.AAC.1
MKTAWERNRRTWTRTNDGRDALSRTENGQFANRRVKVGGLLTSELRATDRSQRTGPTGAA